MLTFEQFQKTATRLSPADAAQELACDIEQFENNAAVWIYDSSVYLSELESGEFHLIIERSEYMSESRADLEKILYLQWYVSESVSDHSETDYKYILDMVSDRFKAGVGSLFDARELVRVAEWAHAGLIAKKGGF